MKLDIHSSVKSADRAFDILEYVASSPEPPSFSQMLVDLEIPRSSLFHLLNNLLGRGYLEQDPVSDRYRVGKQVQKLAGMLSGPPLQVLVAPFLRQLSAELNETCGYYIQDGDAVAAIDSVTSNHALAYTMKVGESAPLYAISAGKIVLAQLTTTDFADYLKRVTFEQFTAHTIASKRRLQEEVIAAKRTGFAYSREEFTPGITGIATAVTHNAQFYGALNLAVPTARFAPERDAAFRRQLRSAASALGQALHARKG